MLIFVDGNLSISPHISSRFLKTLSVPSGVEKGLHENLIRKKYFSWEKDEEDEREKHINPQNKINSCTQKFLWGGKRFSSHIPRLFISFLGRMIPHRKTKDDASGRETTEEKEKLKFIPCRVGDDGRGAVYNLWLCL